MRKVILAGLVTGLVMIVVAACAPAPTEVPTEAPTEVPTEAPTAVPTEAPTAVPTEAPTRTLVVAVPDDPEGLDQMNTYTFGGEVLRNIYDSPLTHEVDLERNTALTDELIGELFESWEVAPDRTSVTFKIKPNATFADGSPVTAEDAVYSWSRSLDNRGFLLNMGGIFSPDQFQIVDEHTITLSFGESGTETEMTRWSLPNFVGLYFQVLSKDYVESHATSEDPWGLEYMARNPMGSGPYMLESWVPGESVTLKARPDYWGEPKPYYTEIQYRIIPDSETRTMLLQSGDVDIAYNLAPHQLDVLSDNPDLQVVSVTAAQEIVAFRMNLGVPPFDDINIRKAVIKAIPYDAILDQAVLGYGTECKSPCGVTTYGYKEYPLYETDLEEARRLVAESKYADGVPEFTLVIPTRYPERVAAAVLIQANLSEIGINMSIQQLPYTAYWNRCTEERYAVNIHTMQPYFNDCLYWAHWMFNSESMTNCTDFKNPEYDAAASESFRVLMEDTATFDTLLKIAIDDTLVGQAVMAPLYQDNWSRAAKKGIEGIVYWPWLSIEYAYLRPATE